MPRDKHSLRSSVLKRETPDFDRAAQPQIVDDAAAHKVNTFIGLRFRHADAATGTHRNPQIRLEIAVGLGYGTFAVIPRILLRRLYDLGGLGFIARWRPRPIAATPRAPSL